MALPSSGVMKASMIRAELGQTSGSWSINSTASRNLARVPSGTIKFSDFYAKSNVREWSGNATVGTITYGGITKNTVYGFTRVEVSGAYNINQIIGSSPSIIEGKYRFGAYARFKTKLNHTPMHGSVEFWNIDMTVRVDIPNAPQKLKVSMLGRTFYFHKNATAGQYEPDTTDHSFEEFLKSNNGKSLTYTITEIKYYLISAFYSLSNILREVI